MTIGIVLVACWATWLARPPPHRHDDAHLQTDQVGGETGVSIVLPLGPSGFNRDVPTLHVAQSAEALPEALQAALSYRVRTGTRRYVTHSGHLLSGLRRSRGKSHGEQQKDSGGKPANHEPYVRPPMRESL